MELSLTRGGKTEQDDDRKHVSKKSGDTASIHLSRLQEVLGMKRTERLELERSLRRYREVADAHLEEKARVEEANQKKRERLERIQEETRRKRSEARAIEQRLQELKRRAERMRAELEDMAERNARTTPAFPGKGAKIAHKDNPGRGQAPVPSPSSPRANTAIPFIGEADDRPTDIFVPGAAITPDYQEDSNEDGFMVPSDDRPVDELTPSMVEVVDEEMHATSGIPRAAALPDSQRWLLFCCSWC